MGKQRNYCISLLKFIALFLMIWGHCIQKGVPNGVNFFENKVYQTIYSFHMPLFMLISGYLFYFSCQKRDLKTLLATRSKPLVFTIVFFGGIFSFLITQFASSILKGNYCDTFYIGNNWLGSTTYLWFLWSVLYSSCYVGIIYKKITNRYLKGALLLLGFLGCLFVPNPPLIVYTYPYFVLGFYLCRFKNTEFIKKLSSLRFISLILFPIGVYFMDSNFFISDVFYVNHYSVLENVCIYIFRYTIGLVGSIFLYTIVKILLDLFIKDKKPKLLNCFANIGDNSLQIYSISTVIVSWYFPVFIKIIHKTFLSNILTQIQNNFILYNFMFTFIISVIYIFVIQIISYVFNKTKLSKILFGKD